MSDYEFDDPKTTSVEQLMAAMDQEQTEQHLAYIRTMSHMDMAYMWRFTPSGHPYFNTDYPLLTRAFADRWELLGGMTPAISKKIGWDK